LNVPKIHWYTMFKTYGEGIFDEYVTQLFDMGKRFGSLIKNESNFELAIEPNSNIICFRYVEDGANLSELNELNQKIRQKLLEKGTFYIVQTQLKGVHYLRCTVMNPFTKVEDFKKLLGEILSVKSCISTV